MLPGLDFGREIFGAWRFVLASFAITLCTAIFFKKNWAAVLGFPKSFSQILACIVVAVLSLVVFYFLLDFLVNFDGYQRLFFMDAPNSKHFGSYPWLLWILFRICQPLNEEIVIRALLLGFFTRFFSHRAYLALLAALVFSGAHWLYYFLGPIRVQLDILALLTLFFFALAANALYLTFNHMGFGFVIHFAWNWWRFSGDIVKDGLSLNEGQTFNAIEGSFAVFTFVALLSLTCVIGLVVHERKQT